MKRLLTLLLFALLTGCSKLTMENYNKIRTGMHYDEVVAILGKPDTCSEMLEVRNCQWGDDSRHVQVNFVAGQVILNYAHNMD